MTKAQLIERYGLEWYEQRKVRVRIHQKTRYQNDPEFRESRKAQTAAYDKNDLNSNGKTKNSIRRLSQYILFDKRHHSRLKGYEIHHCFGYEDPNKFIYIPKTLHNAIHQYLRDNNIDADSCHFDSIKHLLNEYTGYTYISV